MELRFFYFYFILFFFACRSRATELTKHDSPSSFGDTPSVSVLPPRNGEVKVHGVHVDPNHGILYKYVPNDLNGLKKLLFDIQISTVCPGNAESELCSIFNGGEIAYLESYVGKDYSEIVRSVRCQLLTSKNKRCHYCCLYRGSLRRKRSRVTKFKEKESPNPMKWNTRYTIRAHKELFLKHEGQINDEYDDDSFQKLFWEEQKKHYVSITLKVCDGIQCLLDGVSIFIAKALYPL